MNKQREGDREELKTHGEELSGRRLIMSLRRRGKGRERSCVLACVYVYIHRCICISRWCRHGCACVQYVRVRE